MNVFLDNNLSPRVARALDMVAEVDVRHLTEMFEPDTPDTDWLRSLRTTGHWAILTGDDRIHRRPHERRAVLEAGHVLVIYPQGPHSRRAVLRPMALLGLLARNWNDLQRGLDKARAGTIFQLTVNGRLRRRA